MLTLMYVLLLGLSVLFVVSLKHKLQAVEDDLRQQLSRVLAARDIAGPEMWAHFHAQARVLEAFLFKHFYTED